MVGARVGGQIQQALGASEGQRAAVDEVRKVLASEAGASAVRDVRANLFSAALQGASETIAQQLQAFTQSQLVQQQQPTTAERIGGAISGAAGRTLAGLAPARAPAAAEVAAEPTDAFDTAAGAPVIGAAGINVPTQGRLAELSTAFTPQTRLRARRRTGTLGQQFGRQFGETAQPARF
jgi:hypothetical protein